MNSTPCALLRGLTLLLLTGLVTMTSGCGTPRANDVYRLAALDRAALESAPPAVTATAPSEYRLTAAERQLRQFAVHAQLLKPSRPQTATPADALITGLVHSAPGNLHGCRPDDFAEFTIHSANAADDSHLSPDSYPTLAVASRSRH